jgi:hypothetical protein
MELKQQRLMEKIVAAEMEKVRQEAQDDIEAIKFASEERLRETLQNFQQRERDMQAAFKKAVDRAEMYGHRQAEKKLRGEMEALVEDSRRKDEALKKLEKEWKKKQDSWKTERFELEVCTQRAFLFEKRNRLRMQRILRAIKLEFRYSLSEATAELREKAEEVVFEEVAESMRKSAYQSVVANESSKIRNLLRQFETGKYWNQINSQIVRKSKIHRQLLDIAGSCSGGQTENGGVSLCKQFGLKHVDMPVTTTKMQHSMNNDNIYSGSEKQDELCFSVLPDDRESGNIRVSSCDVVKTKRSLLWPASNRIALSDNTNKLSNMQSPDMLHSHERFRMAPSLHIEKRSTFDLIPVKSIKLPHNPFQKNRKESAGDSEEQVYGAEEKFAKNKCKDILCSYGEEAKTLSNEDSDETITILGSESSILDDKESLQFLWRAELEREQIFNEDVPEILDRILSSSDNLIDEKSIKKLLKLWDVVGIPISARSQMLQNIVDSVKCQPPKARLIVNKMCEKLLLFIQERKKEILAVRKREDMKNHLSHKPSDQRKFEKLSNILVRVLARWEEAHKQRFLYRGISYIEILAMEGFL